ncbi:MAG: glycosyltransferase involved in cell wall biosynthesis [Saprospiraceae bacterium]|jgi:glycosyltransferase involved in cell wall biosynthesis
MKLLPLVSIVMPAYNHEKFVSEAIDSVLNQTWENLELIIIDDGSTDSTPDIVKAYDDSRVQYFHQHNQDAYNALNAGLAKTKGEYVGIINSDDVFHPARIERLIDRMIEQQSAAIFSEVSPIDDDSAAITNPEFGWLQWHKNNRDFFLQQPDDVYRGFLKGNLMVTTSNLLMTAEAKNTVGKFAPYRYLHDYDYIFRLLNAFENRVHYAHDEALMNYRIHSGNTISQAAIIGREQDQEIIRNAVLRQVPSAQQERVNVGIDRLVQLEQELHGVRMQLKPAFANDAQNIANIPTASLAKTLLKRLAAKLSGK